MTFNQIALKIFKANLRRYLLYFLCNSFTIMIFFTYSTLYTNKEFMNSSNISSTNNIIAPGLNIIFFSIFFIIYAQGAFMKFRKSEFGLFMVLGMINQDIQRIMILENCLIATVSLLAGLVSGIIFSKLFYLLTIKIINVNDIPFSISIESYIYTIIFFTVIYFLVIIKGFIDSFRYEIISLLKTSRKKDKNFLNSPVWGVIGILLIGIAFYDMKYNFNSKNSIILLRSIIVCFLGLYFFISSIVWLISKIINYRQKNVCKNIFFLADLKYTFGQSKKIIFLITILVSMTIFFSNFTVVYLSAAKRLATAYNHYDIAYAEIFGKNKITVPVIDDILNNSNTTLTSLKKIDFVTEQDLTILCAEDLNKNLGTHIIVKKGHYVSLFQIVKNDGLVHDISEIRSLDFPINGHNINYKPQGKITEVLFNNIPILNVTHLVIFNIKDYQSIKANVQPSDLGDIKLMDFKDWTKTGSILNELQNKLEIYNEKNTKLFYDNINEDIKMFKPASKIGYYSDRKQSGSFSLLLFTFVGILFFVSSVVIMHFKLSSEYENEKIKYKKLYKIGITDSEVSAIITKELRVLFFLPILFATLIAAFYNYSISVNLNPIEGIEGMTSLKYSLIIGLIYLCLQIVLYLVYKRIYVERLIRDSEK